MINERDYETKNSLIVFPFEKPQPLNISFINQLRTSGVVNLEDAGHYWIDAEEADEFIKEGITLDLNEQHCPIRNYRLTSIMGLKLPPDVYSEMPSVKIRIIPRVILCNRGIGVCFHGVRCVYRPTIPEKFALSKSKPVQELLRYYENIRTRNSVPFSNYFTTDNEGHLCLDGNDNKIMQSAYEYALEETRKLFLRDKKNGNYLGASFDSIRIIEEGAFSLILNSNSFFQFFNTWGKAVSDHILNIISNFNMGYANNNPSPLLKLPDELMRIYSERLIKEGVKQNKICWSVGKPVQNEPPAMPGGIMAAAPGLLNRPLEQIINPPEMLQNIFGRAAQQAQAQQLAEFEAFERARQEAGFERERERAEFERFGEEAIRFEPVIPNEVEEAEEDFDEDAGEEDRG